MRRIGSIQDQRALMGPFLIGPILAMAAIAAPALLPVGAQPLLSFHTETLAMLGWGLWLAWLSPRLGRSWRFADLSLQPALCSLLIVVGLLLLSVAASAAFRSLPPAIAARHAGILLAAAVALLAGARLARSLNAQSGTGMYRDLILAAFVLAGLGNAAICGFQFLGLEGPWEPLGKGGRAGGNLGQPNLLGTQLLWAYAALVAWHERGATVRWAFWMVAALLALAAGLSASRTAALSSFLLFVWGWSDRRLTLASRRLLYAAPVLLVLAWLGLEIWHRVAGSGFAGEELLTKADPTSSRWRLWQQCGVLIGQHPWAGVGWGQFNFAWTLTPMPGLPRTAGYTFTHAHDLPLHWAVELGLPLALALAGLLAFAVWRAVHDLRFGQGNTPPIRRAALVMVLVVLLHSFLEFPLWHTHFLLPAAFLLGLAIAVPLDEDSNLLVNPKNAAVAPLLMALAGAFALFDYRGIADVYSPRPEAPPLEQRIAQARQSLLFGHFADRFAGTMAKAGERTPSVYRGTVFEILDWRLLGSWALAYAQRGDIDKARFLAARLGEFDSPAAQLFFVVCAQHPERFQCMPNKRNYSLDEFRADLRAPPSR